MKRFHKLTAAILGVIMTTGAASPAFAAEISPQEVIAAQESDSAGTQMQKEYDGVTYQLKTVSGLDEQYVALTSIIGGVKNLHIPAVIDGLYIIGIEQNAVYRRDNLESVTVDEGVMYIENGNFTHCPNLKTISLPDSLYSVNTDFTDTAHCSDSKNIADGVYYVSNHAISGNRQAARFSFRQGTKTIAPNFCRNNPNLTSVAIPGSVVSVGVNAFFNAPKMKSVTIPAGVELIGHYAFGWKNRDDDYGVDKVKNFTVYGMAGSAAQEYAEYYQYIFKTADVEVGTPLLKSTQSVNEGVKITWEPVFGAVKYRVYYKGRNGWTRMGDTTGTSFVDTVVNSGSTYTYTVRCINSGGTAFRSDYDHTGIQGTYIAPPVLLSAESVDGGVKISWKPSRGAEKYRVFYKGKSGWRSMGETVSTSFVDTEVTSGKSYTYTVRCVCPDCGEFVSGYDNKGIVGTYVEVPRIVYAESTNEGVWLKWKAVDGAVKYRVYYKGRNGFTRFAETSDTHAVDTVVNSGSTYTYTVRCVDAKGKFISDYDREGFKATYVGVPKITKAEATAEGIRIQWEPVKGAKLYRVFCTDENGWTRRLTNTAETGFIDTEVSSGKTYTYTVRCVDEKGRFMSGYDKDGVKVPYYDTPVISSHDYTQDGVVLKWKAVTGASRYRVFIRTFQGWKGVGNTDTNEMQVPYPDTLAAYYTVRCIDKDGNYISSYDKTGYLVDITKPVISWD